jgi:hypothetical protein
MSGRRDEPASRDLGGSYLVDLSWITEDVKQSGPVRDVKGLEFGKQHTRYVKLARGEKKSAAEAAAEANVFLSDKTSEWARIVPMSERRRT